MAEELHYFTLVLFDLSDRKKKSVDTLIKRNFFFLNWRTVSCTFSVTGHGRGIKSSCGALTNDGSGVVPALVDRTVATGQDVSRNPRFSRDALSYTHTQMRDKAHLEHLTPSSVYFRRTLLLSCDLEPLVCSLLVHLMKTTHSPFSWICWSRDQRSFHRSVLHRGVASV